MNPLFERVASQHRRDLEEQARTARLALQTRCCRAPLWTRLVEHLRGVITESCGSTISRRALRTLQVDQTSPPDGAGREGYANVETSP